MKVFKFESKTGIISEGLTASDFKWVKIEKSGVT